MMQDVEPPFENTISSSRRYKGNHPTAGFFHIIFKLVAYLTYMFGGVFFGDSYILFFVLIILLLAADFWTVKNVTGRLMVSLRWWNEIQEDGTNKWQFEAGDINSVHSFDSTFFWVVLFGHVVLWGVNFVVALLGNWKYLPLVTVALCLGFANALGYSKCRSDARKRIELWLAQETVGMIAKNPDLVTAAAVTSLGSVRDVFSSRFSGPAPTATGPDVPFQPQYAFPGGTAYTASHFGPGTV
eukprot:RCo014048